MLAYETLLKKGRISDTENGEYIDLLSNSLKPYDQDSTEWAGIFDGARRVVVSKYYVARPDLISLAIYKDDQFADLICKVNGISNPFEINEDMILLLPSRYKLESIKNDSGNVSGSELTISGAGSTITATEQGNKKLKNERRSPAEATVEDSNYTVDWGLGIVFY